MPEPTPPMERTALETLAEDFVGAPTEEGMDNLRLLTQELVTIDNTTELRLERLESRLGLPDIEDEDEDAEWEPLPELEVLVDARATLEAAMAMLGETAALETAPNTEMKQRAAETAEALQLLLNTIAADEDEEAG